MEPPSKRRRRSTGSTPWIPATSAMARPRTTWGWTLSPSMRSRKTARRAQSPSAPRSSRTWGCGWPKSKSCPSTSRSRRWAMSVMTRTGSRPSTPAWRAGSAPWPSRARGRRWPKAPCSTRSTPRIWSTPSMSTCWPSTPATPCCCAPPRASSNPCRCRRIRLPPSRAAVRCVKPLASMPPAAAMSLS
ncbi:hypothetical protein D3C80_1108260 [compost metagenome]